MLLEFSVENFKSIRNENKLSMIAAKAFKEHEETNVIAVDKNLKLLKTSVIYGNNAGGKSNFIRSMAFMKATILNSFKDALQDNNEKKFEFDKFLLSTKSENETTFFEILFIQNNIKYRYGFELDYDRIIAEWLFHTTTKETYLFKRELQKVQVNKSAFKEGLNLEKNLLDNVLFLTLVAQLNGDTSKQIIDWFKNFNFISGIHDVGYKNYTTEKLKTDKAFSKWVLGFIKYLDIVNISVDERDPDEISVKDLKSNLDDEELINFITSMQKLQAKQPKKNQIITWHKKYDENNFLVDTIPVKFNFESEGTKKLLFLLGPWYDTLKNGKILVIDELDSRLHSGLCSKLIEFFHRKSQKRAQLIFATHDITLLNKNVFRRDQVWFIEKNQFGESELYSLADFRTEKVRNKSAFDKNYVSGKYGAIPYFDNNDDKLSESLYGEER